ncbi:hypothetical protein CCACVL1_27752 [Corchorus capsularis]|uniref:Uncharacterized protein n=1 Tax=Corchorus capsularis TaxID=210143 RepID=A0A1R3G8W2_COCAP|nr:hypothetical protein CCACVL1_27752 [Corchorus capsularis]
MSLKSHNKRILEDESKRNDRRTDVKDGWRSLLGCNSRDKTL